MKKYNLSIGFGVLLLVAAAILYLYNRNEDYHSFIAAQEVNTSLQKIIIEKREEPVEDTSMPQELIDGNAYIGILEIPSLSLSLPVMSSWDYDKLKVAPCYYNGSYLSDDLVICAHNYKAHFGKLKTLDMGEKIRFVTVRGDIYEYQISNARVLKDTAIEDMITNQATDATKEDWDLTLFTCTLGGQARLAIRAIKVS